MKQNGAATILMVLVLMVSVTIITLAVARSQLIEQRIVTTGNWHTRLRLAAERGLAAATELLSRNPGSLVWTPAPPGLTSARQRIAAGATPVSVEYLRSTAADGFVLLRSTAQRADGSGMTVRVSQYLRPLSVLTPAAEQAPPLVLAGCLIPAAADFHIRPLHADSARAGDALWTYTGAGCPGVPGLDLHGGRLRQRPAVTDLWQSIFSVSRLRLAELAAAEQARPPSERRYRTIDVSRLPAGTWSQSLGRASRPVVLHFLPGTGCPQFAPAVRIYGVVFIDDDCSRPAASLQLELFGSLVVNGNFNVQGAELQFNHIRIADPRRTRLDFPVLRSVPVPGTWKDF